jgi:peptide-methionine (R)-S-oxide reductase
MDPEGIKTEISCSVCCGHIGHLFKGEGFDRPTDERIFTCKGSETPTDEHHCVNSLALKFIPENPDDLSD